MLLWQFTDTKHVPLAPINQFNIVCPTSGNHNSAFSNTDLPSLGIL